MEILELAVGKASPFPRPPLGATVSTISVAYTGLMFILQVPDPTEEENNFICSGEIKGIGWYRTAECPIGALMLVLQNNQETQWIIASLIVGTPNEYKNWGEINKENNFCGLILVDSSTNNIVAIRMFGLPRDLLIEIHMAAKLNHYMNIDTAAQHFQQIEQDKAHLWATSEKWVHDAKREEFVPVE